MKFPKRQDIPFLILSVLFLVLSPGCSERLREDPLPPAAQSNFPSAEGYFHGDHFVGLGVTSMQIGQPWDELNFRIQPYYKGTVRVFSESCDVDEFTTYNGNSPIHVSIRKKVEKSCLFSFVVAPTYPKQESSGIKVYPVKGALYVKALSPGIDWTGFTSKVSSSGSASISIPSEQTETVVVRGCDSTFEAPTAPINGMIKVSTDSLGNGGRVRGCVYQGALLESKRRFTWMVWYHASDYQRIPKPLLTQSDETLKVMSDQYVSIVSLDKHWKVGPEQEFDFDPGVPHFLRLLTVSGRVLVGFWSSQGGRWLWVE